MVGGNRAGCDGRHIKSERTPKSKKYSSMNALAGPVGKDHHPYSIHSSRSRAERSERQRRPVPRHRATVAMANVERTFWSPNWSRTRGHGSVLNGTDRHARPIFAIQINTCQDRTKRGETATNKFRVGCFQPAQRTLHGCKEIYLV